MRLRHPEQMSGRSRTLREATAYVVVGGIQLLLDWLCFVLLTSLGLAVAPANLAARTFGAMIGFCLNGRYTFAKPTEQATPTQRKLLRFLIFWLLVTAISTASVSALDQTKGLAAAWLGKPLIDSFLAFLGFLASKYWIYR